MRNHFKQIGHWNIAGLLALAFASVGSAQYTIDLTGVGDGASADGVYVSPYWGTITENGSPIYTGYLICDDFNTDSSLDDPTSADATNAGALDGDQKFTAASYSDPFNAGDTFTDQQAYDAVAWLANGLLASSNVTNPIAQTNYSFAIWDIFDGQALDPDGGAASLIAQAFSAVSAGYVGSDTTVFTPNPLNASQEFLVVSTPESSLPATLAVELSALVGVFFLMRRRLVRTGAAR
jgi:hypothetical protein